LYSLRKFYSCRLTDGSWYVCTVVISFRFFSLAYDICCTLTFILSNTVPPVEQELLTFQNTRVNLRFWVSEWLLLITPTKQFFSYINDFSVRWWWCPLCYKPTLLYYCWISIVLPADRNIAPLGPKNAGSPPSGICDLSWFCLSCLCPLVLLLLKIFTLFDFPIFRLRACVPDEGNYRNDFERTW
jgi:hypothetical protein